MATNTAQVTFSKKFYDATEGGIDAAKEKFLAAPSVAALGIESWEIVATVSDEDDVVLTVPEAAAKAFEAHRHALYEERFSY